MCATGIRQNTLEIVQGWRGTELEPSGAEAGIRTRRSVHTAAFIVLIIVLGSIVVFQQVQISNLSKTISTELAPLTSGVQILNFSVIKQNSTSSPVMYLVVWNNGTAQATSGSVLVGIYGQGSAPQPCYNSTTGIFPLMPNETFATLAPLSCGSIGDSAVLTGSANFLESMTKTVTDRLSARTTIIQPQFEYPPPLVLEQIGIRTVIAPEIGAFSSDYTWYLTVTNESPTPIVSINASAISPTGVSYENNECMMTSGELYSINPLDPLSPRQSCQEQTPLPSPSGFKIGEELQVAIGVKFLNGTVSSLFTSVTVEPSYVVYG